MALIDDLKERRQRALDKAQILTSQWMDLDEERLKWCQLAADCDIAIAALEPPAEATPEPEPEPEIPEGFAKWEGGPCPVDGSALIEYQLRGADSPPLDPRPAFLLRWDHAGVLGDIIAYRAVPQPVDYEDPTAVAIAAYIEGETPLESVSEFAEEGYAPVVEAEPLADPIWNEPEPTKPEADFSAKAHDYYNPKAVAERDRFNPFNIFKRESDQ